MKTRLSLAALFSAILIFTFWHSQLAFGSVSKELYHEDFSQIPPPPKGDDGGGDDGGEKKGKGDEEGGGEEEGDPHGFYEGWDGINNYNEGWVRSLNGMGGENGAMTTTLYWWSDQTKSVASPWVDISEYSGESDEVALDMDYYIQENDEDYYYMVTLNYDETEGLTPNRFTILVQSDAGSYRIHTGQVAETYTDPERTDFYGNQDEWPEPNTDESTWKHLHVDLPLEHRYGSIRFSFLADHGDFVAATISVDNLVITGTHLEQLVLDSKSINFGSVSQYNKSGDVCINVSNPTFRPITIYNASIVGANASDFKFSKELPMTVEPGATETMCMYFEPTNKDLRQALVVLNTDGDKQEQIIVDMRGIGLMPYIETPTPILFRGTRTRFDNARYADLIINNTGGAPMNIESAKIGGDFPEEYKIEHMPEGPIAAGQSDKIVVSYTPRVEGSRPASIDVASNAVNGTLHIELRGVGVLPRMVLTPSPLQFDSVSIGEESCKMVTIYNPGSDTLELNQQLMIGADVDYRFTPLSGNDLKIAPEKSRQFEVCFHPVRNGTRVARIRYETNIPLTFEEERHDTGSVVLNIRGTGVPVGALALEGDESFDSTIIGTELCQTVSFSNTGMSPLTVTGTSVGGNNASEFALSGVNLPFMVQPGETKSVTVCATPSVRGIRNANLNVTFTSNEKTLTSSLPLGVFGQLVCAEPDVTQLFSTPVVIGQNDTKTVTISNCGDVAQSFTATVTGADYSIVGAATSAVVQPGGTTSFQVKYTPVSCGASAGSLSFLGSATGSAPMPVTVNGIGEGMNLTSQVPNDVIASSVGETKEFVIHVTNTTAAQWTPGTPVITGPFELVTPVSGSINGGATLDVTLRFKPTQTGVSTGTITFPASAPSECTASVIALKGEVPTAGVKTVAEKNGYALEQNYPNPFNPSTTIRYTLPTTSNVKIVITDVKGEVVRTVIQEKMSAGAHSVMVDASNLASGTYYYSLIAGNVTLTRQMMLVK